MNEETKPAERQTVETPTPAVKEKRTRWLPMIALLVVFLAGFVPMWLKSNRLGTELLNTQRQARVMAIQLTLADAALDARRGDYEPARQAMMRFFNEVTAEAARGIGSALPAGAAASLQPMLAQRDELITLLARSDPASAERLATAYADFIKSLGN